MTTNITANPLDPGNDELERYALEECLKRQRVDHRTSILIIPARRCDLAKRFARLEGSIVLANEPACRQEIEGRIVAVDNRVDVVSRSLRVQARIGNADDRLRAGMAFRIDIAFTGDSYPAVDPLAIQWGADGAYVWVVRGGTALQVPIRILQRNAADVLIEAAFEPDDLVVTEGVQTLRTGAEVSVAPPRT